MQYGAAAGVSHYERKAALRFLAGCSKTWQAFIDSIDISCSPDVPGGSE